MWEWGDVVFHCSLWAVGGLIGGVLLGYFIGVMTAMARLTDWFVNHPDDTHVSMAKLIQIVRTGNNGVRHD